MPALTLSKILIWPQSCVFKLHLTKDKDSLYNDTLNTQY